MCHLPKARSGVAGLVLGYTYMAVATSEYVTGAGRRISIFYWRNTKAGQVLMSKYVVESNDENKDVLTQKDPEIANSGETRSEPRRILRRGSTLHLLSKGLVREWTDHIDSAYTSTYHETHREKRCCNNIVAPLDVLILIHFLQISGSFFPLFGQRQSNSIFSVIWKWKAIQVRAFATC